MNVEIDLENRIFSLHAVEKENMISCAERLNSRLELIISREPATYLVLQISSSRFISEDVRLSFNAYSLPDQL